MDHAATTRGDRCGSGGHLLVGRGFHQRNVESLALAVTHRLDLDCLTGIVVANDSLQRADAIHRLTIRGDDDVTRLEACLLSRSVLAREIANENATDVLHTSDSGVFRADIVDADSQRLNTDVPVGDELIHDTLGQRDWNCEAVAGIVTGGARDRAVDADHFTVCIHQRTAGIAGIDRRISLDQVTDRVLVCPVRVDQLWKRTALGAYDSGCNRVLETERVANRENPLTDPRTG